MSIRRYSRALLLWAIAGLLVACGDGTGWQAGSNGGGGGGGGSTGPNTVTLTWDVVTDPNLGGYRVYYGTAPGTYLQSPGSGEDAGKSTLHTVTGLSSATTYYFTATAYDTSNNESTFSNEVVKVIP